MKWLKLAQTVVGLVAIIISSVERDGDGAAKKHEALELWRKLIGEIDRSVFDAPDWIVDLMISDAVAGFIIDMLVRVANRSGIFTSGGSQAP